MYSRVVKFKYGVALTGGIATGKSSASAILKELGFEIVDADKIAHSILDREFIAIGKLFGKKYIKDDNSINRKELGKLIFNNKRAKEKLENFIHPLIYKEITDIADRFDRLKKRYILDIPLFFETNRYRVDRVIVVYTPRDIQLQRLIKRDKISKEEALARLNAQIDIEEKKRLATYIIDNSGDFKNLEKETKRVAKILTD
jgi:dephospho-CoA kinase